MLICLIVSRSLRRKAREDTYGTFQVNKRAYLLHCPALETRWKEIKIYILKSKYAKSSNKAWSI